MCCYVLWRRAYGFLLLRLTKNLPWKEWERELQQIGKILVDYRPARTFYCTYLGAGQRSTCLQESPRLLAAAAAAAADSTVQPSQRF